MTKSKLLRISPSALLPQVHSLPQPEPVADEGSDHHVSTNSPDSTPLDNLRRRIDPLFVMIVAVAALCRFFGLNWDQGFHLHPDERFLTMVGNAQTLPGSLAQYLNPTTSTLNPANVGSPGHFTFFVYGTLPLILNKLLAVVLNHDTYDLFTQQGRFLSALFDLLVLPFIYKTARILEEEYGWPVQVKHVATALYAIAVLPIQLAHFFAVDTFQNFFMFAAFFFALRFSVRGGSLSVFASAALFGCAMASKTSAVFILPLILVFLVLPFVPNLPRHIEDFPGDLREVFGTRKEAARRILGAVEVMFVFGLTAYIVLRLGDPYMFQSSSMLDPRLSDLFVSNLRQLQGYNTPDAWFPPGVQWINKPAVIFALANLVFFGIGLGTFLFLVMGGAVLWSRRTRVELVAILVWVAACFLFESVQYTKNMRYFLFLYPFLALFAALGFQAVIGYLRPTYRVLVGLGLLIWPLAFMSIYVHQHSRVDASTWMFRHIPNGSILLSESWDDRLPLPVTATFNKIYPGSIPISNRQRADLGLSSSNRDPLSLEMPVFDQDTPQKWKTMKLLLAKADYLVLSSNRGWDSMTTVPDRYPRMTAFYHNLFAGKLAYKRVAQFTSYPSLRYLGIPIDFPDDWSEESFTVYDHPVVMIFRHVR